MAPGLQFEIVPEFVTPVTRLSREIVSILRKVEKKELSIERNENFDNYDFAFMRYCKTFTYSHTF